MADTDMPDVEPYDDMWPERGLSARGLADRKVQASMKRSGKIERIVTHPNANIGFLISGEKVIVITSMQAFLLVPVEVPGNLWRRRLLKIRDDALKRKIRNFEDLVVPCRDAINIVPTQVRWHV